MVCVCQGKNALPLAHQLATALPQLYPLTLTHETQDPFIDCPFKPGILPQFCANNQRAGDEIFDRFDEAGRVI